MTVVAVIMIVLVLGMLRLSRLLELLVLNLESDVIDLEFISTHFVDL